MEGDTESSVFEDVYIEHTAYRTSAMLVPSLRGWISTICVEIVLV
jgi:hypothetical protein